MKGTKPRRKELDMTQEFENLVSYERYKAYIANVVIDGKFENLVSYERYKASSFLVSFLPQFENLVSYERYKAYAFSNQRR